MSVLTAVEHFLLLGTVLMLATSAAAWLVRLAVRRGWCSVSSHALARLYGAAIVTPPVAAVWVAAAALAPQWWLEPGTFAAAHTGMEHELHLLAAALAPLEPTPAVVTLTFLLVAVSLVAVSSVRGALRVRAALAALAGTAPPPPAAQLRRIESGARRHGLELGLLLTPYPVSFVWGLRRAKLIVSSGLLHALNADGVRGVLEHEAAHHARRDNAVRAVLSAASYATLAVPLARRILGWWADEVELACDAAAASATRDPLALASALVAVRRGTAPPIPALTMGFVADDASTVERRVRSLVTLADGLPSLAAAQAMRRSPGALAVVGGVSFVITLAAVIVSAPLAVHRAAEAVLTAGW